MYKSLDAYAAKAPSRNPVKSSLKLKEKMQVHQFFSHTALNKPKDVQTNWNSYKNYNRPEIRSSKNVDVGLTRGIETPVEESDYNRHLNYNFGRLPTGEDKIILEEHKYGPTAVSHKKYTDDSSFFSSDNKISYKNFNLGELIGKINEESQKLCSNIFVENNEKAVTCERNVILEESGHKKDVKYGKIKTKNVPFNQFSRIKVNTESKNSGSPYGSYNNFRFESSSSDHIKKNTINSSVELVKNLKNDILNALNNIEQNYLESLYNFEYDEEMYKQPKKGIDQAIKGAENNNYGFNNIETASVVDHVNQDMIDANSESSIDDYADIASQVDNGGYCGYKLNNDYNKIKIGTSSTNSTSNSNKNRIQSDLLKNEFIFEVKDYDKYSNFTYTEDLDPKYLTKVNATFKKKSTFTKLFISGKKVVVLDILDKNELFHNCLEPLVVFYQDSKPKSKYANLDEVPSGEFYSIKRVIILNEHMNHNEENRETIYKNDSLEDLVFKEQEHTGECESENKSCEALSLAHTKLRNKNRDYSLSRNNRKKQLESYRTYGDILLNITDTKNWRRPVFERNCYEKLKSFNRSYSSHRHKYWRRYIEQTNNLTSLDISKTCLSEINIKLCTKALNESSDRHPTFNVSKFAKFSYPRKESLKGKESFIKSCAMQENLLLHTVGIRKNVNTAESIDCIDKKTCKVNKPTCEEIFTEEAFMIGNRSRDNEISELLLKN